MKRGNRMELQANRARDRKREAGAVYERIALDIAKRIERGELSEGVRLSGRTLMSGEYGVSPETIRRSFALLEEMDVVHVMHNSGVLVNSREKAKTFVDKYGKNDASKSLLHRMREILEEHEALNKELYSIAKQLFSLNTRFHEANPFPIHEYMVGEESKAIGKSLSDLDFWHHSGATVIAIRREGVITLSPGPEVLLQAYDTLMMVGGEETLPKVRMLLD